MNYPNMRNVLFGVALSLGLSLSLSPAQAQEEGEMAPSLMKGGYIAPMGTYVIADKQSDLSNGGGGVLMLGHRSGFYAIEVGGVLQKLSGTTLTGIAANALLFPFKSAPGLYGTVGLGALEYSNYPGLESYKNPHAINGNAGAGFIFPMKLGSYDFALRSEVRYRIGKRDKRQNDTDIDLDMPRRFDDVLINVGLHLPLSKSPPPPPPPEPVKVVEPADADGDGVTDDLDQCPGTPAGTKVDAKGCPLPPPCKAPEAGEKITMAGCATGDILVLRGVNFEFDKSKLTVNASTILDNVAEELTAYPSIKVEIAGHTDAQGSDEYNQRLSESRAASVMEYLTSKGVAADRMTMVGLGESQPVADNDSDEGRELNRRVELRITAGNQSEAAAPAAASPAAPAAEGAPAAEPVAPDSTVAAPVSEGAPAGDPAVAEPVAPVAVP